MSRGWANPFGNQPVISKDVVLGKGKTMSNNNSMMNPSPYKKNTPAVKGTNSNTSANITGMMPANSANAILDTEELIQDNKHKSRQTYKHETVRKPVVDYGDLVDENMITTKTNKNRDSEVKAPINLMPAASTIKFTSVQYGDNKHKKRDDFQDLLDGMDSDEELYKKQIQRNDLSSQLVVSSGIQPVNFKSKNPIYKDFDSSALKNESYSQISRHKHNPSLNYDHNSSVGLIGNDYATETERSPPEGSKRETTKESAVRPGIVTNHNQSNFNVEDQGFKNNNNSSNLKEDQDELDDMLAEFDW